MSETGTPVRRILLGVLANSLLLSIFAGAAFAGTGTSNYLPYASSMGNVHGGYATTSTKCSVCHSVHGAPVSGYVDESTGVTAGPDPEMLMRSSVADSCTYCHITTNLGGMMVYDGSEDNYVINNPFGHQKDDVLCVDCHTVHGAGAIDSPLAQNLRKPEDPQGAANGTPVLPWGPDAPPTSPEHSNPTTQGVVSWFCTNCHKYYSDSSATRISVQTWDPSTETTVTSSYKTHPMVNASANFSNPDAGYSGRVAWGSSLYCRSCHAAGTGNEFPHYSEGAASFIVSRPYAQDASGTPANQPIGDYAFFDGACIGCHRSNPSDPTNVPAGESAGVGITY
jgi:hypothetical protein